MTDKTPQPGNPPWTFGDRLRKARKHAHLSQEQMAAQLGVPLSSYGTWEAERAVPRGAVLIEIAQKVSAITGVSVEWLLGIADSQTPRMYVMPRNSTDVLIGSLPAQRVG